MPDVAKRRADIALQLALLVFSTLVYLAAVYRSISSFESFKSGAAAFAISAVALGLVYSTFGFRRPLLTTFYLTAPAPVLCYLAYLGVTAALAGDPKILGQVSPERWFAVTALFFTVYAAAYGLLAVLGCLIGSRIRAALAEAFVKMDGITGGSPVRAAKIAAMATVGVGLFTTLGTVLAAVLGHK